MVHTVGVRMSHGPGRAEVLRVRDVDDIAGVVLQAKSGRPVTVSIDAGDTAVLLETVVAELRRVGPHVHVVSGDAGGPALPASAVDDQARAILDLLADGLTIAQAARRLGISARTATRRIDGARQALGVGTTAEAVVATRPRASGSTAALPALVGREAVLAHVQALLGDDRAVLLVGEGAVGKTAILDAVVRADGRPVHRSGGLQTLTWRDQWAIRDAARLPWDDGDADTVALQVEAVVGPDLLVMDDVHLVDAGSRRALASLAGRLAILAAARPGGDDPVVADLCGAGFVRVDVEPLTPREMADLVRRLAPEASAADVTAIVTRSGGLPLLAEFHCRQEPGLAVGRGLVPTIEALSDGARREALALALADHPLPPGATTSELVSSAIAVVDGSGVRGRHALVADALTDAATTEEVTAAHAILADYFLAQGLRGSAARHRLAAGDHGAAEDLADEGYGHATTVGEQAQFLLLAARAAWAAGRADRVTPALRSLSVAGRHEDVLSLSAEVPPVDSDARSAYALVRSRAHWHRGDAAEAVREARNGLAEQGGPDSPVDPALLREVVRCELLSVGPQPDHADLLLRARGLSDAAGEGEVAAQLAVEGLHAYFGGDPAAGAALWERGRQTAEAEGDIDSLMRCSNNVISWNESSGDPMLALRLAVRMAGVAQDRGMGEWRGQFMAMAANQHYHQGHYAEAMRLLDEIDSTVMDRQTRRQADITRLAALIDLGLLDDSARLLAAQDTDLTRDWLRDDGVLYLRAAHAYWSGDPRTAIEIAARVSDSTGEPVLVWFPRSVMAWAQYDLGIPVDVSTEGTTYPIVSGMAREVHAVRLLQEDPVAALAAFDESASVGRPWSYALSLRAAYGAAEAARLAGADSSVDRLLEVEKLCLEAGLEPLLAKVHRSLRLAGIRRAARRAPDRSGLLTERERLVLDLSARGATYDEIARRLGVGRSTVRRLLDSARARLGAAGKFAAVAALPVD